MEKKYRAALVGLGDIAWRYDQRIDAEYCLTHAATYIHNHCTTIVAGCSPDENDRLSFQKNFNVPVYKTIDELINGANPDIVSICSPEKFHYEQVLCCFERNIPMIWLEKPPVSSPSELDELVQRHIGNENKTRVLVNYQRRYNRAYQELRDIYSSKKMGRCRFIHVTYSMGLERNGSHMLDMIFFILGDAVQLELDWVTRGRDHSNPCFNLVHEDGMRISVTGIKLPYHCIDISLICEYGRASVLYGGMKSTIELRIENELYPGFYRLAENKDENINAVNVDNSMKGALKDLISSYEYGRYPQSNLSSARNTQVIISKIRQMQGYPEI